MRPQDLTSLVMIEKTRIFPPLDEASIAIFLIRVNLDKRLVLVPYNLFVEVYLQHRCKEMISSFTGEQ